MIDTVLFDLGNTLAAYFDRPQFPGILEEAIAEVQGYLQNEGFTLDCHEDIGARTQAEKFTAANYAVRTLEGRLQRIFLINDNQASPELLLEMCRRYLRPIFALSTVYDDVLPTLQALKLQGIRTAILSNTPWGSPGSLWREEVDRLGLTQYMDGVFFCVDCGWRKPARQAFEYAMDKLGVAPEQCVFVGDDPRWDIAGPKAIGMPALLIDRGAATVPDEGTLTSLLQLPERLRLCS